MTLLDTLRPQYSQPQSAPVAVRPGVLSLLVPGIGDVAPGGRFTLGANGLLEPAEQGQTLRGPGAANVATLAPTWHGQTALTLLMVIRVNGWTGTFDVPFELTPDAGHHPGGIGAFHGGSNTLVLQCRGANAQVATDYSRPAPGGWEVWAALFNFSGTNADTSIRFFRNGLRQAGTVRQPGAPGVIAAAAQPMHLLNRNASSLPLNANLACFAVCAGWLPDEIVTRLRTPADVWQYVTEPRRVWVPGSAAGVPTIVSTTAPLSWSVRNAVDVTRPLGWSVRAGVAVAAPLSWGVRNLASVTRPAAWSVRNLAHTTVPLSWSVQGAGIVSTTAPLAWSVRNITSANAPLAWSVRTRIDTTAPTSWSVRNLAATTRPLAWSVHTFVSATHPLAWSVRNLASATRPLSWSVRNLAAAARPISWSVNWTPGAVTLPPVIIWHIETAGGLDARITAGGLDARIN